MSISTVVRPTWTGYLGPFFERPKKAENVDTCYLSGTQCYCFMVLFTTHKADYLKNRHFVKTL